jgi:hypothetical protein
LYENHSFPYDPILIDVCGLFATEKSKTLKEKQEIEGELARRNASY